MRNLKNFDDNKNEFSDGRTEITGHALHPKAKPYVVLGLFVFSICLIFDMFFEIPFMVKIIAYSITILSIGIIIVPQLYIWKKK